MYPITYAVYFCILLLCSGTGQTQSDNYYNQISTSTFSDYKPIELALKSKYGNVYHAYEKEKSGSMLDFYVFEKIEGDKKTLFKMDELTQIRNDSTFMLCEPPLKMAGDTTNWVNGIWFYANSEKSGTTHFNVDSMPARIPTINYQKLEMGIYQYKDNKLVKISNDQSGDSFYERKATGFFYLPNPGFFYKLVDFRDIK